jgi:hypothetical protein
MIIGNIANGQTDEGKQVLFLVTVLSLSFMIMYYHNQIKLSKMKIEEMKIAKAEGKLSHQD